MDININVFLVVIVFMMDSNENLIENKICYICQEEELAVKFLPCKHQIGNNCANRLYKLKHLDCPFCLLNINIFRGIQISPYNQEMNCLCEMEKNSITLKPCNHRLGYIFANTLKSWYIRTQKCPTCQSDIKSYEDDANKTPSIFQKSFRRLKSFSKIGECVNNILDNHIDKSIELYYE